MINSNRVLKNRNQPSILSPQVSGLSPHPSILSPQVSGFIPHPSEPSGFRSQPSNIPQVSGFSLQPSQISSLRFQVSALSLCFLVSSLIPPLWAFSFELSAFFPSGFRSQPSAFVFWFQPSALL